MMFLLLTCTEIVKTVISVCNCYQINNTNTRSLSYTLNFYIISKFYFVFVQDPLSLSPQKALDAIGSNLQKQYERWQPRARYKHSLDPTAEDVKKLCTSLRKNAKEERVLFHYNGHGVPKPTVNGEIWVFNRVSIFFSII